MGYFIDSAQKKCLTHCFLSNIYSQIQFLKKTCITAAFIGWFSFVQCLMPVAAAAFLGEFTITDELELGRKFNILIRARMPIIQDPEVVTYIEDLVKRIAAQLPPQPFTFTSSVIRHNALNAFACPGGYLFVHTGLLLAMENESELVGVLSHEMAHVTQRHIASRIEQGQIIGLLSILGALAGAFLGNGEAKGAAMVGSLAGGQAAMLQYGRSDETEADQVGLNYAIKAGFNPNGMVKAFTILGRKQWLMGSEIPTYLSTHPAIQERIKDISNRIASLPANITQRKDNNTQFLRVQAIIRARYSDPDVATQVFATQLAGSQKCLALMGQGILADRQNQVNAAANAFDSALACSPDDPLILREAGRFHYFKGNSSKGATLLQQAIARDRNDIMAQFFYGRYLADTGKTDLAIDYFRTVLRSVPEDSEVHEYLARYYAKTGQMFKANLHMAYSALYENNKKKIVQFLDKAKPLGKTPEEKQQLERFNAVYKERKEFW